MRQFFQILFLIALNFAPVIIHAQNKVKLAGAMRNVMWKGELQGVISLDTLNENIYGLGPVEYLKGELMLVNGEIFRSQIVNSKEILVDLPVSEKAPFFVYAKVKAWKEYDLPENVHNMKDLEIHLLKISSLDQPFVFMIKGLIDSARIHIMNLPGGSKISSPEDAHKARIEFDLKNESADILGFFSTKHQGLFTHHDSYLHMHLLSGNKQTMGHIDDLIFNGRLVKLFLPSE